jgi:hypothetical protein
MEALARAVMDAPVVRAALQVLQGGAGDVRAALEIARVVLRATRQPAGTAKAGAR